MNYKPQNPEPKTQNLASKVGAVMVVGGGIAGIQASLDLADAGYYVHLVEKDSAIGGVMPQLDKTFPTNDCSMCIISPKLVECGRHLNIEIRPLTEVRRISGAPGNLTVTLENQPRFIDPARCTGCGACAEACPVKLPDEFNLGLGESKAVYRRYPQAVPGTYAIRKLDVSPCRLACPAGINAQAFVQLVGAGKYLEAVEKMMERVPFHGVLGRVCPHPCESKCRRGEMDEPVAICSLGRFATDRVNGDAVLLSPAEPLPGKIAIIGAGPAGLTCAYHLALKGYRPTVLEALPQAGGMLRVGIPDYRLPKKVLDDEINNILHLGVELKHNTALGRDFTLDGLFEEGYQAVFLGIGCHMGKSLGVEGEDNPGVVQGVDFLRRHNLGEAQTVGQRLAVIGGGNVAIDVACTALRLGSEVTIVYRRSQEEMPAFEHEIEQALGEGVKIIYLAAPLKVLTDAAGAITGLLCQKMELGEADASGRRKPVPIPDAAFELPVDMIIPAIGQEAAQGALKDCGLTLSRWGTIEVDEVTYQTSRPGVFAAGDVHTGPWIAVEAIGGGIEAAESIDRYLKGVDLKAGRTSGREAHGRWRDFPKNEEGQPREIMTALPPESSCCSFEEIVKGYTEEQARREASRCLNCSICCECLECAKACQAGAVDHHQEPQKEELHVGAVILGPGFKPFDAREKPEYGYGRYPNVVTSLEFERLLSATGPCAGHVRRPSDGADPKKIAWIQCVGSRDECVGREYCSSVCCMYATKQALIAREHDRGVEPTVFFIDLRAQGKGFDRYYERAREAHGVRYLRSMVSRVTEDPRTRNLEITYVAEDNTIQTETFDLVVLSVGLTAHPAARELAEVAGIATNRWGFTETPPFELVSTNREGIFTCGAFQSPKDIPDSVSQASAAAASAARLLAEARGTMVKQAEYPPERSVAGEEPRIGVFVCRCGINIAGVVKVPEVVEFARTLPGVVYADNFTFTCSSDSLETMREKIASANLNRVVVAACSPRTHEALFMDNLRQAGLNKYLFKFTNIRDQDSWVHQQQPEAATAKAKELVAMSVARVINQEGLQDLPFQVTQTALVIGGGLAGLTAALTIADAGFDVNLVEKEGQLGGMARQVHYTLEGHEMQPFLEHLVQRVENHSRIRVFKNTQIKCSSGHLGKFNGTLAGPQGEEDISFGAVVVATGGLEYSPTEYLYGRNPRVLTQLELENRLVTAPQTLPDKPRVVMIQCVGCREPEHPYCSRLCCGEAVKNAIKIKEMRPEAEIFVLYREMRTFAFKELFYKKAREMGVRFLRYEPEAKPEVVPAAGRLEVSVWEPGLKMPLSLEADFLVLSAAVRPHPGSKDISRIFKLPLDGDGFFMEAHAKLRPLDFALDGVFLCGLAHGPKYAEETVSQAKGAAVRALRVLSREEISISGMVSQVIKCRCAKCLTCVRSCPFAVPVIDPRIGASYIDAAKCHGCGICAAECPYKAIELRHNQDDQILAEIGGGINL